MRCAAWRSARVLAARYHAGLFVSLLVVPIAAAVVARGSAAQMGLRTSVGLPILGDGRVAAWVVLALYAAVVISPLLSWGHSTVEVGAPDFERRSLLFPHALALALGLALAGALSSSVTRGSSVFWVAASMAAANLGSLVLRRLAWVALLAGAVLTLSLLLQGRLDVVRPGHEALTACVAWLALALAAVSRQHHRLTRATPG